MVKNWELSKNKNLELQIDTSGDLAEYFVFCLESRSYQDHPGFVFRFEIFKQFYFCLTYYDKRHWETIEEEHENRINVQSDDGC